VPLSSDFGKVPFEIDFSVPKTLSIPGKPGDLDDQYVIDYNYILKEPETGSKNRKMMDACVLSHDGLALNVRTTAPSIHVYTGRYNSFYKETRHGPFSGVAFEPVRYLDSINQEKWREWAILKPGERYYQDTELHLALA